MAMTKPSSELSAVGPTANISAFLASVAADVDRALDRLIPPEYFEPQQVHQAIRWSLFAGGKRLRPALVIAVGECFGARRKSLLGTAAALEMIHTYSLIHDDLPAMDNDDLRRGRATCHVKFDEATAILAGDALQSLAFQTIAEDPTVGIDRRLELIALIASAAGTPLGMVAGQALDLAGELATVDDVGLAMIHHKKTGALFTASAVAGALIADAADSEMDQIRNFAGHLGLLFQITDDLLDVTASAAELGKTPGKDERAQKATYVSRFGLEGARRLADAEHRAARAALDRIDRDTNLLQVLTDHFQGRRA
jgi:geranylgeranyl pyrophosphate synthase